LHKSMILAALAAIIGFAAVPAIAEEHSPVGPERTTWQLRGGPLDALLNDGWFIFLVAGEDGEILILNKDKKFVRCHLSGRPADRMLDLSSEAYSECHGLN